MMVQLSRALTLILSSTCLFFGQQAPPEPSAVFQAGTELVLVPFTVGQGLYFATNVKPDDVVLLQDGKPREFTVFDGPGTGRRPPLELALLFDTTMLPPPGSKDKIWD